MQTNEGRAVLIGGAAYSQPSGARRTCRQATITKTEGREHDLRSAGRDERSPERTAIRRLLRATEIDTRMLGMIGALLLIWVGFNIYTQIQTGESLFLTPRNLWNLSVQTSSIAIMATGMVLVIVMRHIDLSVGSIIGFVSTIIGVAQVHILPVYLGLDNPAIWIIAVVIALAIGAAIGAFHGSLVAYLGIPAFIVTLGAQLFWRGAAWWVTTGQTIAPLDDRFALMGGGPHGSIGATASWALCAARLRRHRFQPLRRAAEARALPFSATADVGRIYDRRASVACSSSARPRS